MASTAILAIRIVSDATKAAKEIDKVSDSTSKMSKVSSAAGKAFAVGLGLVAVAGVKAANAAAEDQAAAAKLANTLKNATGATQGQVKATEDWIAAQGEALGVTDTELRPALSKLAVATGDVAKAQELAALAMDVSAGSGKSLESVSAALAKAQNGNLSGLQKLGVATKDAHGNTKSLEQITKDLANTYKGAASTAAETTAGKQKRLQVAMGELQEKIGTGLIPILGALVAAGMAVVGWIEDNTTTALVLAGVIGTLVAIVAAVNVVTKVWVATQAAWAAITKVVAAGQWALNAALTANPVGLIIVAVIALVAGLVLLYKKSAAFRAIVQAVGKAGQAAIGWIVTKAKELYGWIAARVPAAFALAKTLVVGYIKLITTPFRTLLDVIKSVVAFVRDKAPAAFATFKTLVVGYVNLILTPFRTLWNLIQDIIGAIKNIKIPDLPDLNPLNRSSFGGGTSSSGAVVVQVQMSGSFVGSKTELAEELAPVFERVLSRQRRRVVA